MPPGRSERVLTSVSADRLICRRAKFVFVFVLVLGVGVDRGRRFVVIVSISAAR